MSDFPSEWSVLPLGEVAEVVGGGTPSRDIPAFWGNDHYWITPSEVVALDGKMVNRSKEKISDLGLASSGAKLHPPGTILMTSRASIGFAAIAAEEICTNQGFQSLRCGSDLDNWFALHQIRHRRAELQQLAAGSTFLEVSGSNVRSLPFVVPPLPEQKKIAEILSGIDNTTKAFFKKKKKNDLILRQVIIDATTPNHGSSWHESTIGDVVEFQGGAQPPRSTFKFAPEAGYIRMLQIRDYKSDARATYIPLDLCKRFCDREDVMIGRYGPPNFQILRGKEGSYNVALIKAMPKDSVVLSKDYLYRFLQRGDLFVLMDTLSQRTSGQQGLDMDALKGFPMFIPDLATQEYICRSISAIESISLGLNARVQSLNHLKSGISGQLLSGRKRVSV